MYEVNSQTVSKEYKAETVPLKEWKFQISNGNTGEMTISDVLLDTEALARERAMSEFLKNAYRNSEIRFSTYRTDFVKNMTISVYGIPYLIKSMTTTEAFPSLKTQIRAIRYD